VALFPTPALAGTTNFFAAFSRFAGIDPRHIGEWIDEVVSRGAAQNEQYIELMASPPAARLPAIVREIGWNDDFALLWQDLLAHGLRDDIGGASALLNRAESARREPERCGTPDERQHARYKWVTSTRSLVAALKN
jgi:adenosine deaminase